MLGSDRSETAVSLRVGDQIVITETVVNIFAIPAEVRKSELLSAISDDGSWLKLSFGGYEDEDWYSANADEDDDEDISQAVARNLMLSNAVGWFRARGSSIIEDLDDDTKP